MIVAFSHNFICSKNHKAYTLCTISAVHSKNRSIFSLYHLNNEPTRADPFYDQTLYQNYINPVDSKIFSLPASHPHSPTKEFSINNPRVYQNFALGTIFPEKKKTNKERKKKGEEKNSVVPLELMKIRERERSHGGPTVDDFAR